jgi:hypothetical protein
MITLLQFAFISQGRTCGDIGNACITACGSHVIRQGGLEHAAYLKVHGVAGRTVQQEGALHQLWSERVALQYPSSFMGQR